MNIEAILATHGMKYALDVADTHVTLISSRGWVYVRGVCEAGIFVYPLVVGTHFFGRKKARRRPNC